MSVNLLDVHIANVKMIRFIFTFVFFLVSIVVTIDVVFVNFNFSIFLLSILFASRSIRNKSIIDFNNIIDIVSMLFMKICLKFFVEIDLIIINDVVNINIINHVKFHFNFAKIVVDIFISTFFVIANEYYFDFVITIVSIFDISITISIISFFLLIIIIMSLLAILFKTLFYSQLFLKTKNSNDVKIETLISTTIFFQA